ncbi:MAG: hypothetical protein EA370_03920 [Wenzhouxiangella sp.]|nr:MAG: hypothetical protein EA370_03920 [Wenzhouxiangella sp.]
MALLLSACASLPEQSTGVTTAEIRALQEINRAMPGEYLASRNRQQRERDEPALRISVEALPSGQLEQTGFTLSQYQEGGPIRHFLLAMTAGNDGQASGAFAPLDETGQAQRRCDMIFTLHYNGFSGETNPQTCRFGTGQNTGLLKEIAFDGARLVIADRLIDLETGEPMAVDQVHRFFRAQSYSGWAGRLEGDSWRVVQEFSLSAGHPTAPVDAAGMSLGLALELEFIEMAEGDEALLRLNVSDSESGTVIAQAWADTEAESLGVALPDLQVGMRLLRR